MNKDTERDQDTDRASWCFVASPVWWMDLLGGFTFGLWLNNRPLLGLRLRRNWPASDPVYPGRGGEFGILFAGRFVGFWNDAGF